METFPTPVHSDATVQYFHVETPNDSKSIERSEEGESNDGQLDVNEDSSCHNIVLVSVQEENPSQFSPSTAAQNPIE